MTPSPDFIVLTETWLPPSIYDSELGLSNFTIYRKDRCYSEDVERGGGVLIAVHKKYFSEPCSSHLNIPDDSALDQLFITVHIESAKILLGVAYFPPHLDSTVEDYQFHANYVENLSSNLQDHEIIIFGDYNLPNIKWNSENYLDFNTDENTSALTRQKTAIISNSFSFLGLGQYFPIKQSKGYTLDLAFSSLQLVLEQSLDYLLPPCRHHDYAYFEVPFSHSTVLNFTSVQFNFFKGDYEAINSALSETCWSDIFINNDIDSNIERFYKVLFDVISKFVPKSRVYCQDSFPVWYSMDLKSLIFEKKLTHRAWKRSGLQEDYINFKRLRARCIRLSLSCLENYAEKMENEIRINSKKFWSYVNNLKKNNGLPDSMFLGFNSATNGADICQLLSTHFKSVYRTTNNYTLPDDFFFEDQPCIIQSRFISPEEIFNAINNSKNSGSFGPDLVPSVFIKNSSLTLIEPLTYLFNLSISTCTFPTSWKTSFITPIFKKGDRRNVENYRPISLISCIPKLLDAIMANKLSEAIFSMIVSEQHGFIKGKSTVTNLLLFSTEVASAFDNNQQVDAVYLDFSKAFDSVSHIKLLSKLKLFGIRGPLLLWFKSYLTNRKQIVKIKDSTSNITDVLSGVPQGSHLGPILFIMFVNDIVTNINHAKILLYADDIKIYINVSSEADTILLQNDLNEIISWSINNELFLNTSKCKVLSYFKHRKNNPLIATYTIDSNELDRVSVFNDLGVIFDKCLSFSSHIEHLVSKVSGMIGFLMRSSVKFKNIWTLLHLYRCMVLSILEYASPVWSPGYAYLRIQIEQVQHRFLRYCAFKLGRPMRYDNHNYDWIMYALNIPSVESVHRYNDVVFTFKILRGLIAVSELRTLFTQRDLSYNLRAARILRESNSDTHFSFLTPVNRLRRLWNALPSNVQSIDSLLSFKQSARLIFKTVTPLS